MQIDAFVEKQLPGGYSLVFCIELKTETYAKNFLLNYIIFIMPHLCGVESLIEWRAFIDSTVKPELLKISVFVDKIDILIADLDRTLVQ